MAMRRSSAEPARQLVLCAEPLDPLVAGGGAAGPDSEAVGLAEGQPQGVRCRSVLAVTLFTLANPRAGWHAALQLIG